MWESNYKNNNSWFWKDFVEALNIVKANICWAIGDEVNILAWNCNWIPCGKGLRKPVLVILGPNIIVRDLWNQNKRMGDTEHSDSL